MENPGSLGPLGTATGRSEADGPCSTSEGSKLEYGGWITSMSNGDTRIVYGATCTWWDSILKVGSRSMNVYLDSRAAVGVSIPCCPLCGGMLFEMPNEDAFLKGAIEHEAKGHPGYVQFVRWARGKCYPSYEAAEAAYRSVS